MEFFSWIGIPQVFLSYFSLQLEDGSVASVLAFENKVLTISLIVAAALYLIGHLFGGFGLYKMAKRAEDKFAWMAFVPVLNTYLSGRLAGETNIFGAKVKRMGLYTAIVELLYILLNIIVLMLGAFLADPQWNQVTTQTYNGETFITGTEYLLENMPLSIRWMPTAEFALQIVTEIWSFVVLFLFIFLYISFFRRYYARSPFVMALLCSFFPVRGYVLFAVRNNTPVDYDQWMQERIRRMQQQQSGQYGGPYGSNDPYSGPNAGYGGDRSGTGPNGEPFSDTSEPSAQDHDEPFSDL